MCKAEGRSSEDKTQHLNERSDMSEERMACKEEKGWRKNRVAAEVK